MMKIFKQLAILVISISGLVACGTSADSAAEYIENGKKLLAENKPQKARIEFKNAIQVDPKVAESYYQLALLDEKAKSWKSMFSNLSKVEQLDPKHHEASIKLGQLYLLSGNIEFAMERASKVIGEDDSNLMAWVLKSSVGLKQENYGLAMADVEKALTIDSGNIEAISLKAILLNKQGKAKEAVRLLSSAINEKPDELALKMIKLSILEEQKDYQAMEIVYEGLMVSHASETWVYVSLAKLYNQQDEYLKAKVVLEKLVRVQPENEEAKLLLVSLVQAKDPVAATKLLGAYIKNDSTAFELRFAKVRLLIMAGKSAEAKNELEQIVSLEKTGVNANKANVMLANYDMQKRDKVAAAVRLDQVLANEPEHEAALLMKSRIEIMNAEIDSAVTRLRLVLRNNPESEQALVLLAQAYMSSGSEELAEDNFRQALAVNPGNTVAALSVAQGLMKSKDLNRTETVLLNALNKTPNNNAILQTLAQVRLLKKDWLGTQSIVDTLLHGDKNSIVASYLSARISQGQERYAEAIAIYKEVLEERPAVTRALQGLAFCSLKLDQKNELIDYLAAFRLKNPRQFTAYAIQSNIHLREDSFDKALVVLRQGLAVEPKWLNGYSAIASVYLKQDDFDKAANAYQEGLNVMPKSTGLAMQLASLYEQNGMFGDAKKLYERVLEQDANIEPAINNLASLLTDQFRSDANLIKAEKITKRFKSATEPYFLDTYAWVKVQLGQFDQALPVLERVVSLAPDVAVFNYHIAVLYSKRENTEKAKEYLNLAKELADKQGDKVIGRDAAKLLAEVK